MPIFAPLLIGGAIFGGLALLQRFWSRYDPASPYGKDEATAKVLQAFAEAETARQAPDGQGQWSPLYGLDRIVASKTVSEIPASVRLDFARTMPSEPDRLREFLGNMQRQAVDRAHADPSSVTYADPWKVAWTQIKRGSFIEGAGGVAEALKRNLDTVYSRKTGVLDSFGRNVVRDMGMDEDDPVFGPLSGTLDFATVLLGDPLLMVGKGIKIVRGATIAGRIPATGFTGRAVARAFPQRVITAETGERFTDFADVAAKMPGVRNWARLVAKEDNPGTVLWWERLGGGVIDDDNLRRLVSTTKDPEKITDLLAEGLRRGSVYRLPVWGQRGRSRLSLLARTQNVNYGRRAFDDVVDMNDPGFYDDFIARYHYFHGPGVPEAEGVKWLERVAVAPVEEKIKVVEEMVAEGLRSRAKDITQPHAAKLARKAGVTARSWDELADAIVDGSDDVVRERAKTLGLDVSAVSPRVSDDVVGAGTRVEFDWSGSRLSGTVEEILPHPNKLVASSEAFGKDVYRVRVSKTRTVDVVTDAATPVSTVPSGTPGSGAYDIRTVVRQAIKSMPDDLATQATENVSTFAGGYFTQKSRAYGYVPGHGVIDMPLLSTQTERHMALPSYQSLWLWENELHGLAGARGMARRSWSRLSLRLDKFTAPWRGLIVSTPRTVMRNLSDDVLAAMSHPEWGGRVLRNTAWGAWDQVAGSAFPGRPFFRFVGKVAGKGKGTRLGRLREGVEEASVAIPSRDLRRVARLSEKAAEGLQTPERVRQATTWNRMVGFGQSLDSSTQQALNSRNLAAADWTIWRTVDKGDPAFVEAWAHFVNHQVLQDDAVKYLLGQLDDPDFATALRSYMDSEAGKLQRKLMHTAAKTPEEFVALKEELLRYAIPDDLMVYAKQGYIPPEKLVEFYKRHPEKVPDLVTGPSTLFNSNDPNVRAAIGTLSRTVAKATDWFYGTAGAAADMLGRNPAYREAFLSNFARLEAHAKRLATQGVKVSEDELVFRARRLAEREVLELVDNFADRTSIGVLSRGFLSFLDAHVRFWKRWGRIAVRNPAQLEKVRLLFGAGESMGWIEPDDHGNLVFTVPVAPELFAALLPGDKDLYKSWFSFTVGRDSKVLSAKGAAGVLDLAENFGKLITPKGLPFSLDVIPGLSPVLSFPIDYLTMNQPGIREVADRILGAAPRYDPNKAGFTDSVVYSFIPTWVRDIGRIFEDEDADMIKGQAVADALKYELKRFADDHGRLPGKNELPKIYAEAQNIAQHALVGKVLARLFSPFAQSRVPYGKEVAEDWHHFRAELGPEEGFERFIQKHGPGAVGFTVPTSKSEDGAPINYSQEAEKFFLANQEFFRDYPQVAGFFTRDMPGFEVDVLSRMRARGERTWIPPQQLLAEAFYRLGNREYYDVVRPAYLEALSEASGRDERASLSLWLEGQRNEIDAKYPGWKKAYAAASSNAQMRAVAIEELRLAVQDPAVATSKAAEASRRFLKLYDSALVQAQNEGFSTIGGRDFLDTRRWLAHQAQTIAVTSGSEGFRSIYEFLFRPMLERLEDDYISSRSPTKRSTSPRSLTSSRRTA